MNKKEQRALLFGKIKPQGNQSNDGMHKLLSQLVEPVGSEDIIDLSDSTGLVFDCKAAARDSVPSDNRTPGVVVTYQYFVDEEQTEKETALEQFIGVEWSTGDALWADYIPQPSSPTAIHVVAESNTVVNGYHVPSLSPKQVGDIFTALACGDLAIVTDAGGNMHFLVSQADIIDGDKHISFDYYDKMQLQYHGDGSVTYTSMGGSSQATVIEIPPLEPDHYYTAQELVQAGLTPELVDSITSGKPCVFKIDVYGDIYYSSAVVVMPDDSIATGFIKLVVGFVSANGKAGGSIAMDSDDGQRFLVYVKES